MSGIYGIMGDAGLGEVAAMGRRLVHRGAGGGEWAVTPTLKLGQRRCGRIDEIFVAPTAPVAFDGFVDNRLELTKSLGSAAAGLCDDATLVYALYRVHGPNAFRL